MNEESSPGAAGRRGFLGAGGALAALGLLGAAGFFPGRAAAAQAAWDPALFGVHSLREAIAALGGSTPIDSQDIVWGNTPDIAENGQVVPISVTSRIPGTQAIALFIAKNPNPMAALYDVPAGTDPAFRTNFRLAESSSVVALVRAGDKLHLASHEIKVTIGGCGG